MQYQPKVKSSSYFRRLSTARVKHHKKSITPDTITSSPKSKHRNNENITSEKYSDNIIMEKYKLLNSVMKPATSSDSASGKSKGTLLLSTKIQILYITKKNTLNNISKIS